MAPVMNIVLWTALGVLALLFLGTGGCELQSHERTTCHTPVSASLAHPAEGHTWAEIRAVLRSSVWNERAACTSCWISSTPTLSSRSTAEACRERRQCRQLLPPTRVVEEEAGERGAPVFQHTHERSTRQVRRRAIVRHKRQADAIERCTNQKFHIVDHKRSLHSDR